MADKRDAHITVEIEQDEPVLGTVDEDIDFDYSQTHLEDFLKTHGQNSLVKNSNIQST